MSLKLPFPTSLAELKAINPNLNKADSASCQSLPQGSSL